jgi:hypothetical protein
MGSIVISITLLQFYAQHHLNTGLEMLEELFLPQWQAAQQLQNRVHSAAFIASQMTLASTVGELETVHSGLSEELKLLDDSLKIVQNQSSNTELKTNLSTAVSDFMVSLEQLKTAVKARLSRSDAEAPGSESVKRQRRERDLTRLVQKDAIKLASFCSLLASDSSAAFQAHRERQRLYTRLLLFFIALSGTIICALAWFQFRLLDYKLIRRISSLQSNLTHLKFDHNPVTMSRNVDEIDTLYSDLTRLLQRLDEQRNELEHLHEEHKPHN